MDLAAELSRYGPEVSPAAVSPDEARAYCRALARSHYENFTVASRLFPRHLQQHLANVYAYCRWADDLADEVVGTLRVPSAQVVGTLRVPSALGGCRSAANEPNQPGFAADVRSANEPPRNHGEWACHAANPSHPTDHGTRSVPTTYSSLALLDWWQSQLDAMFAGQASHPVFVALAETVREFDLSRRPLADLLIAFRRDQVQTRYENMHDLLTYCEKSANPVGRIVLCLGRSLDSENVRLSDSICTGLQLANFWQDVKRDWQRGRIYIPQDVLARYGWGEGRFAAERCDDDFRRLLAPLVHEAEAMLRAGQPLVDRVHRDLRLPVRVFMDGGLAILAAIRAARYDVWSRRPTVGRLTKLRLLARAWWCG